MTSLLRLAERMLMYSRKPKFSDDANGLRAKADWMDARDKARMDLLNVVRPRMEAIRTRAAKINRIRYMRRVEEGHGRR